MNGRKTAGVSGVEKLQEIEGLGSSNFAKDYPIRPVANGGFFEFCQRVRRSDELAEVKQRVLGGWLHERRLLWWIWVLLSERRRAKAAQGKQMPFTRGAGACPSALSRAPGFGVHRSAAKTLDRRSGRIRRRENRPFAENTIRPVKGDPLLENLSQ